MDKPYKTRWWAIFDPAAIVADPLLQDSVLAVLMINIVILVLTTLSNIRKGFDNVQTQQCKVQIRACPWCPK